jgi:uncharacterized protein YbjQ (UPF0145 family)
VVRLPRIGATAGEGPRGQQGVIARMVDEGAAKGANAVVGGRCMTSEVGRVRVENCAYGTVVRARRL